MKTANLALLLPMVPIRPAAAQENLLTRPAACTDDTQTSVNACAAAAYRAADARLNAAYRRILARLVDDPGRSAFVDAQRAWLRFRDAECAFVIAGNECGTIQPMLQARCLESLTRQRTAALESYLACTRDGCIVPPAT